MLFCSSGYSMWSIYKSGKILCSNSLHSSGFCMTFPNKKSLDMLNFSQFVCLFSICSVSLLFMLFLPAFCHLFAGKLWFFLLLYTVFWQITISLTFLTIFNSKNVTVHSHAIRKGAFSAFSLLCS